MNEGRFHAVRQLARSTLEEINPEALEAPPETRAAPLLLFAHSIEHRHLTAFRRLRRPRRLPRRGVEEGNDHE
jgi:hypothetical protein